MDIVGEDAVLTEIQLIRIGIIVMLVIVVMMDLVIDQFMEVLIITDVISVMVDYVYFAVVVINM